MKRRSFLKHLGALGVLSGIPGFGLGRAFGQVSGVAGEAPRRLLVIGHCHGWPYQQWKIHPEGVDGSSPWALDLNAMSLDDFSAPLRPLHPFRQRLLALDGLSLATAELDMDGNRHDTGWVQAWTGSWANFSGGDTGSTAPSIDQIAASVIARADRLPSLELSVMDALEPGRPIAYGRNGIRLPMESETLRVWERLFGPSLAPSSLDPRQKSVLDFAYGEYAAMAPDLDNAQRLKLEAHFELLAGLRERLDGMAKLACTDVPEPVSSLPSYDQRFDAMSELIGAAFSCDITRVVSLSLGEMPTANFGADDITDDVHKGLAHEIYNNPSKHQAMTDYLTLHGEQVARLVSLLENIPDIDGRTVMDNTLIVWGSELADGWHGYRHYCPVIIGGDWHFSTGKYWYRPHETPIRMLVPASISENGYTDVSGLPHQHLLTSIAEAMDLGHESVGLKHVQGQNGDWVDTSGPLPEVT